MRVYTANEFKGFFPVGTAAVVVAKDMTHAAELLNAELKRIGLPESVKPTDFSEVSKTHACAYVLQDGNY